MPKEPEVCFNMDLANAPTGARFVYEAMNVLGAREDELDLSADGEEWSGELDDHPYLSEIVDEWTDKLDAAGYYVRWDAGDVVVFDLRAFTDEEREEWYAEEER